MLKLYLLWICLLTIRGGLCRLVYFWFVGLCFACGLVGRLFVAFRFADCGEGCSSASCEFARFEFSLGMA